MNNAINNLSTAKNIEAGDLIPIFQGSSGRARAASVGALAVRVSEMIEGEQDETTYGLLTAGNGFSLPIVPQTAGGSVWAQIATSGTASAATITLPSAIDRGDGQEVLVTVTNAVTALTVNGGDATVKGAPASMAANGFFRLRYDSVSNTWFRVG